MMPWYFRTPARVEQERTEIEALSADASWLVGHEWRLSDGLSLDAVIRAHGYDYCVRVSFPSLYPELPPSVRPLKQDQRLSSHQYGGADGPLCLEWGPDNWHPDITAARMLESAFRLFDTENPLGEQRPAIELIAPSRHRLTIGQEVRGRLIRSYAGESFRQFMMSFPTGMAGEYKFSFRSSGDGWILLVHEASSLTGNNWIDPAIPSNMTGATAASRDSGVWLRTDLAAETIQAAETLDQLRSLAAPYSEASLFATDGTSPVTGFRDGTKGVLFSDIEGGLHQFLVLADGSAIGSAEVHSPSSSTTARLAAGIDPTGMRVGIVGLGAAGSKIALSLARMGVHSFYLVDHDLMLPENVVRHSLDWDSVIWYKVDGVARALKLIHGNVQVNVSRLFLVGQESAAAVNGVLEQLRRCDVVIDATANGRVFNLMAAVSRSSGKPLVWFEIYGGGVGGVIGRSRPGHDPDALDMRAAYLSYCADNRVPESMATATDYGQEIDDSRVLIATDSEVAVIASHAARFAYDCLGAPGATGFPFSMYLIGMATCWVFEAPFAVIPVSMAELPISARDQPVGEMTDATVTFLSELVAKQNQ
jgi:sulfur-carrier protein adenylyltransferase/sulfurtransferase